MINNNLETNKSTEHSSGVVYRKSTGFYEVHPDSDRVNAVTCTISSKLRKDLIYPLADPSSRRQRVLDVKDIKMTDPVAINDRVIFIDSGDGTGVITEILPRSNKLNRLSPRNKKMEQVIVANVDQVVVVTPASKAKKHWSFVDCFLADAEVAEIPVLMCISKTDIADDDFMDGVRVYEKMGYPTVLTSVVDKTGLDDFSNAIRDKVSVLVGKSGVGKSSLINSIQPGFELFVKEVSSKTGKGKHATTHLELFPLDFGGGVVDTPGMRKFGLWEGSDLDIAYLYRDLRPYLGQCRFGSDCSHTHEPGCAIKDALDAGEISEMRYRSYMKMAR
ncbi:ribosome small subunit-dependent GTPase A [bacterium]|nr:ribosome small subunit-dependent GTPase A [bacterium]